MRTESERGSPRWPLVERPAAPPGEEAVATDLEHGAGECGSLTEDA